MAQFNPDLLLKDELSYEALLRGLPHANVSHGIAQVYTRKWIWSVSYTHLDVYKRQVLVRAHKDEMDEALEKDAVCHQHYSINWHYLSIHYKIDRECLQKSKRNFTGRWKSKGD